MPRLIHFSVNLSPPFQPATASPTPKAAAGAASESGLSGKTSIRESERATIYVHGLENLSADVTHGRFQTETTWR